MRVRNREVRVGYGGCESKEEEALVDPGEREEEKGSTKKDKKKKNFQFKCHKILEDEKIARKKIFQIEIIMACQNSHGKKNFKIM